MIGTESDNVYERPNSKVKLGYEIEKKELIKLRKLDEFRDSKGWNDVKHRLTEEVLKLGDSKQESLAEDNLGIEKATTYLVRLIVRESFSHLVNPDEIRYQQENLIPQLQRTFADNSAYLKSMISLKGKLDDSQYQSLIISAIDMIMENALKEARSVVLQMESVTDDLTGINTLKYLEDIMGHRLLERFSKDKFGAVVMLDIDKFKNFNDVHGHQVGDKTLQVFATFLLDAFRQEDYVARYGGEEFSVFIPELAGEDSDEVVYKVQVIMERVYRDMQNFEFENPENHGEKLKVTFSAGVKVFAYQEVAYLYSGKEIPLERDSSEFRKNLKMLFKQADGALYQAKENGRNRIELHESGDQKENTKSILLVGQNL